MADYTLSSGDYFRPYRCPWGQPEVAVGLESTAQTYRVGQVLESDQTNSTSLGKLRTALVSGSTVTSSAIVGIAAEPASSVNLGKRIYFPANPLQQFVGRTIRGVLGSTCLFKAYGLAYDSTLGINLVDFGNTASTSERVIVTELVDEIGDSGGRVAFKFGAYNSTVTFYGQPK
jgi:hypothetical protein